MFFYLGILVLTTSLVYVSETKEKFDYLYWFSFLILILILTFRNIHCANDTIFYYNYFMHPEIDVPKFEILYDLTNKLVYYLHGNYNCLLFVNAFLSLFPVFYVINKIKINKYIYIFIYQTLVLYIFNFAIMRQTIAMSLLLMAVYFYLTKEGSKKFIYYSFFVLLAIGFHKSAILFFPIILLDIVKFDKNKLVIVVLTTIFITLFRKNILIFVFELVAPDKIFYIENMNFDFGIVPFVLFLSGIIIDSFCTLETNMFEYSYNLIKKINIFMLYFCTFLCWIPLTGRFNQYGYLNLMFLLGFLYNKIYEKKYKYIFILILFMFYIIMLIKNPYQVIPYFV